MPPTGWMRIGGSGRTASTDSTCTWLRSRRTRCKHGRAKGDTMTGRSDTTSVQAKEFVITRVFQAPRALVWQAFAESERLAQWWGPKGFTIAVSTFEFRPDGVF